MQDDVDSYGGQGGGIFFEGLDGRCFDSLRLAGLLDALFEVED